MRNSIVAQHTPSYITEQLPFASESNWHASLLLSIGLRACGRYKGRKSCVLGFGGKTWGKETTWKIWEWMVG